MMAPKQLGAAHRGSSFPHRTRVFGSSDSSTRTRVFGCSPSPGFALRWSLYLLKRLHCRSVATPNAPAMQPICAESENVYDRRSRGVGLPAVNTSDFAPFHEIGDRHAYA